MSVVPPPAQPLRREWGYQGTSQQASEVAWEAREGPEVLSCPFVHGAAKDEGTQCQPLGRGWRDSRRVCLQACARGSVPTTGVGRALGAPVPASEETEAPSWVDWVSKASNWRGPRCVCVFAASGPLS